LQILVPAGAAPTIYLNSSFHLAVRHTNILTPSKLWEISPRMYR
jgi:hypothetical protein